MKRVNAPTRQPTAIERLFTAVQEGETDRLLALLHPGVEWTPTVWSGERMYRGHEGIHLWLSQFGEHLEHLDVRVQKAEASGNRGAVLGIVFDTRGEQKFSVKVAWSYELEDGLLRRGRAHDTWEEALEAAGLAGENPPPIPAGPAPTTPRLARVRHALRLGSDCPVRRRLARRSAERLQRQHQRHR